MKRQKSQLAKIFIKRGKIVDAYSHLSKVYDQFMDNIPYDEWCKYIVRLLERDGIKDGLVLELGCGTGQVTRRLKNAGFDMIGVEISEEMLSVAIENESEGILYLCQDMREFELYGTVRAVVSICDSMNYITENEDITNVFKLVNNYLDPKGIFIFDLNTRSYYSKIGDSVIAENRENASFIWENNYYPDEAVNEYNMTLFLEDENGKYDKFTETHIQRAYSFEEIKSSFEEAGLELLTCYNAFTEEKVESDEAMEMCDRVYFVARENGKLCS